MKKEDAIFLADKEWYAEGSFDGGENFEYLIEENFTKTNQYLLTNLYSIDWVSINWKKYNEITKEIQKFTDFKFFKIDKKLISKSFNLFLNLGETLKNQINNKKNNVRINKVLFRENYFIIISLHFKLLKKKKGIYCKNPFKFFFNNNEKTIMKKQKRSIRSEIPMKRRLKIFQRDKYTCSYCNYKNGIDGEKERIMSIDHIVPISQGGTNKEDNLTTCCLNCNIRKNDKFLPELIKDWIWIPEN